MQIEKEWACVYQDYILLKEETKNDLVSRMWDTRVPEGAEVVALPKAHGTAVIGTPTGVYVEHAQPTTVSDIIEALEDIREEHGDIRILIGGPPGDYAYVDTKRSFGETCAIIGLTKEND